MALPLRDATKTYPDSKKDRDLWTMPCTLDKFLFWGFVGISNSVSKSFDILPSSFSIRSFREKEALDWRSWKSFVDCSYVFRFSVTKPFPCISESSVVFTSSDIWDFWSAVTVWGDGERLPLFLARFFTNWNRDGDERPESLDFLLAVVSLDGSEDLNWWKGSKFTPRWVLFLGDLDPPEGFFLLALTDFCFRKGGNWWEALQCYWIDRKKSACRNVRNIYQMTRLISAKYSSGQTINIANLPLVNSSSYTYM